MPHFCKYPLQSAKKIDFLFLQKCVEVIISKKHLSKEGLDLIVSIKGAMKCFATHYQKS
jgi:hypothetical protein